MADESDFNTPRESAEWWVCWNGDPKGPLSFKQVRQWLKEGKISRDSFVKCGGEGKWVLVAKAGIVPDLDGVFRSVGTAALLLFLAETFVLSITHPHLVPWCLGLILVYMRLIYRTFGPPKKIAKMIQWFKYHFF